MRRLCFILAVYALLSLTLSAFIRLGMEGQRLPSATQPYEIIIGIVLLGLLIASALVVINAARIASPVERTGAILAARWGSSAINAAAGGILLSYGLRPIRWNWFGFFSGLVVIGLTTLVLAFAAELLGRVIAKKHVSTGHCPNCGYDLRIQRRAGLNRCPVCGEPIEEIH